MKIAILGATKGMGRALARRMAERGDSLFLLGRDADELARSASDLAARGATGRVDGAVCDLEKPDTFDSALEAAEKSSEISAKWTKETLSKVGALTKSQLTAFLDGHL